MAKHINRFPLVMKTTAVCTGLGTAAFALLHHVCPERWILSAAITCGTTFYHFAMRLLVGTIVPPLAGNVDPRHRWFQQRSREAGFYRKLGVKRWKQNLPTYDPSQFDLTKHTLRQVVCNMCRAELVHEVIIVLSFVPLLFTIPFGTFPVFLITSILAAVYDSIFVIAQRYNRPRLIRILKKKEAAAHE